MRFVTFGVAGAASSLLRQASVRSLIEWLYCGKPVASADIPSLAINAGLIQETPTGLQLGPAIVVAPPHEEQVMKEASATAAKIIRSHLPELRRSWSTSSDCDGLTWSDVGLLVVGGALLDLGVGEELCRSGAVQSPVDSLVWLLPDSPSVSLGMKCSYDDARGVGAAAMWLSPGPPAPSLPWRGDLSSLLGDTPDRHQTAAARLRLRHGGWLSGEGARFLYVDREADLGWLLARVAQDLVSSVYTPTFEKLAVAAGGHPRLIVSRLIFERTVAKLLDSGVLAHSSAASIRRMVWKGPDWQLAEPMSLDGSRG